MNRKTLTALRASIAHHKKNLKAKTPDQVKLGPKHCALCALFLKDDYCTHCPVAIKTEKPFCKDTPYRVLFDACQVWLSNKGSQSRAIFRDAERAEIKFLEGLLP